MQVYEYLNQAKRLDSLIQNKREEEQELWSLATSMTQSMDGMPHGTSDPDKMTNIVQKIIAVREQTNEAIDKYVDAKQDIIRHLEMLPRKQYDVLYWLYIKKRENRNPGQKWYYTWSEVAEGLGCTEQNISERRKNAVRNLQKILDSEEKQTKVDCF